MDFKHIKREDIYIGNILKVTNIAKMGSFVDEISTFGSLGVGCFVGSGNFDVESELFKANACLVKVADSGYVDLEQIPSIFGPIQINRLLVCDGHGFKMNRGIMHDSHFLSREGTYYVDGDTLRNAGDLMEPVYTLRKLKNEVRKYK